MKPPKGEKCDAAIATEATQWSGQIKVIRCGNDATETLLWGGDITNLGGMETWLCEYHAPIFNEKTNYHRNPKRRK